MSLTSNQQIMPIEEDYFEEHTQNATYYNEFFMADQSQMSDDEEMKPADLGCYDHQEIIMQKQLELGYFPMDMQAACGFDTQGYPLPSMYGEEHDEDNTLRSIINSINNKLDMQYYQNSKQQQVYPPSWSDFLQRILECLSKPSVLLAAILLVIFMYMSVQTGVKKQELNEMQSQLSKFEQSQKNLTSVVADISSIIKNNKTIQTSNITSTAQNNGTKDQENTISPITNNMSNLDGNISTTIINDTASQHDNKTSIISNKEVNETSHIEQNTSNEATNITNVNTTSKLQELSKQNADKELEKEVSNKPVINETGDWGVDHVHLHPLSPHPVPLEKNLQDKLYDLKDKMSDGMADLKSNLLTHLDKINTEPKDENKNRI